MCVCVFFSFAKMEIEIKLNREIEAHSNKHTGRKHTQKKMKNENSVGREGGRERLQRKSIGWHDSWHRIAAIFRTKITTRYEIQIELTTLLSQQTEVITINAYSDTHTHTHTLIKYVRVACIEGDSSGSN